MHVTELAVNKTIGIQLAPADRDHLLELPESPLLLNHVGTVHASVQFALAEACSGEFLLRQLGEALPGAFAVLRTSEVKFRRPAQGLLRASARFTEGTSEAIAGELAGRGRTLASMRVDVFDLQHVVTMTGEFVWFLQRETSP